MKKYIRVSTVLAITCASLLAAGQLVPSDLMENCNQWKITYPTGSEDKTLCNEPNNEYFYVNDDDDAIVFRAPIRSNNGTTPNSSYIRSELRERNSTGNSDIYWTTDGSHMVYVKQAITHLPINKSHLVATQIHGNKDDGIDDAMVLRLEDSHLFLSFNGGVLRSNLTIKNNYSLGTVHEVIFLVVDGKHYCYYAEDGNLWNAYSKDSAANYLIKDGSNDFVMDKNYVDSYFKIGNYTQSNADKEGADTGKPNNYGEVLVYDFKVSHAAVAPTGIIINPPMLDLVVGQTRQLSVTTLPSDAAAQEVTYSSDNTAVATVNAEGVVTAISRGSAAILATSTDGKFTSTCQVKVVGEAFGPNLALNKTATTTSTHDADHEIANLVDGLTSTRWSVSGYPQTATIDMGAEYTIGRTELVCYKDRDYQFTVSVATEENGEYAQVVDRSDNQTQGAVAYPIIDEFTGVKARYVKLTITGADAYTGTWMSLMEFRVFGEDEKVSLDELSPYQEVKLRPNPAKNIVHFYGDYDFESVLVYDYQGVLVMHQEGSSTSLNIQSLNSGLYVLKFYGNDKIRTSRLLKQ